ncbi:MAG: 2-succinyl-6-hydroxy-2,4-cyclohexadiene-1-carboxylate synthase [Chloroflexi bacterium RBG_16_68_14]|nr:MAG: 2-succinyl-6-hydroxy-2,4-cyclohexadiene-1-carboxylate synthase [Chloroflexi bacterium RBG_16_68_14]
MTRVAVNGMHLNVEVRGEGPALLLLHGFTGSGATWTPHLEAWEGFTTVAVDLLGHGQSDCPPDPARYRMERCVEDLTVLLDELGIRRAVVLGYSMGGRVALHLALHAPERLWALVLESASAGIEDAAEREERARSDAALAEAIERDGVAAFVDRWQDQPLFASQARLPAAIREEVRRQRLRNDPRGLANSLRGMGAGVQEPLLNRLGELRVPVLLLAGALDEKYCALARLMAAALPCARLEVVPEAGHAVHLERPETFVGAVREFLVGCLAGERRKERERCR